MTQINICFTYLHYFCYCSYHNLVSVCQYGSHTNCDLLNHFYLYQGVKILFHPVVFFLLAKSYFALFFGKCPILSYILASLSLILVFYSIFIIIIPYEEHSSKFFSLALLGIILLFVHVMLGSIFGPFSLLDALLSI